MSSQTIGKLLSVAAGTRRHPLDLKGRSLCHYPPSKRKQHQLPFKEASLSEPPSYSPGASQFLVYTVSSWLGVFVWLKSLCISSISALVSWTTALWDLLLLFLDIFYKNAGGKWQMISVHQISSPCTISNTPYIQIYRWVSSIIQNTYLTWISKSFHEWKNY